MSQLKDRYTLGDFSVTAAKGEAGKVTIEKFVDIACLSVGLGAYSQWLEDNDKKGDALLKKGLQTAYRYAPLFNQGFEEYFAPLMERSDAGVLKQAWKAASRPGGKADAFARKGAFIGVVIPWLKRHTQLFRDLFPGRAYQGALKLSGAVTEDSPESTLHKLALIPATGGLRAPAKWNKDAAKAVGAEPSEPEIVQVQAESLQPTIQEMRDVQSKMEVTEPDTQEAADLAAQKAALASEIEEAAMESEDPDALRNSANSQLAEQPSSKIAHEAGLTPEQTKALLAEGKVLMTAGAGSGKCVRLDTLIQTTEGMFPISSFSKGLEKDADEPLVKRIHGPNGPEDTSHIYYNGFSHTLKLKTQAGFEIEATPNHRIYAIRNGEVQWVRMDELTVEDYVVIDRRPGLFASDPFIREEVTSNIGGFQGTKGGAENIPLELTPQVAQLLGWIVSEGYVRKDEWSISLCTAYKEQLDMYRSAMSGLFEWQERTEEGGRTSPNQQPQWVCEFSRRHIVETLMAFGMTRTGAAGKEIPFGILQSPKPVVREFLRTLFHGDGGVEDNIIGYSTVSDKLARQLQVLLLSFGVVARVRKKPTKSTIGYAWVFAISGNALRTFIDEIGFNTKAKQDLAELLYARDTNTNVDVVPTVAAKCASVLATYKAATGTTHSKHPSYGAFKEYRKGRRRPSHKGLRNFLDAYSLPGNEDWEALNDLVGGWFFDPVETIEDSLDYTADFVVPESHAFSGNGFINHNTRTLAAKIAYFVKEKGYRPEQIMATSFTRKSADELKGRVKDLFGITEAEINTTHSISGNIIRKFRPDLEKALFKAPDFTSYLFKLAMAQVALPKTGGKGRGKYAAQRGNFDKGKVSYLFKEPLGEWFNLGQKLEDEKGRPIGQKRIANYTGKWKMGGWTPEKAWDFYKGQEMEFPVAYFAAAVFGAYEFLKKENSTTAPALDFDDWLLEAEKILREDDQAREAVQRRFKVVLTDESQDLNATQHSLFDMIAGKADTYAMIGDDKQCVSINTMVTTPEGEVRADELVPGDEVLSYRKGQVVKQIVRHVVPSSWTEGFKITTEEGRTLSMSPNHKIWATEPQTEDGQVAVYLMHRPDMGFRIGVTNKGKAKRGEGYHNSYGGRAFLEKADKMWILDICENREEALLLEDDYSLTYGIPQAVFNGEHRGLSQSRIEELFRRHGKNGSKLLEAKHLSFDFPHWISQSYTKHGRARRTVQLIAHSGSGSQVALEWSGEDLDEAVSVLPKNANGKVFTQAGNRRRIRRWFANYRQALQFAQALSSATGALLSEKLSTPEEALRLITASGLHKGMKVAVQEGEGIYQDTIVSIEKIEDSFVDLDVDDASNFFGNGILSHNSIYSFRGADPELFIDKSKEGFEVETLTMNFRSGKSIVEAANRLIAHNEKQIPMVCEANVERKGMGQISCRTPPTHEAAAVDVSKEIESSIKGGASPDDFGIVVRNNAEKDAYTMMLAFRGIPVRGGTDIFSKPIIAAALAWLRINAGGSEEQINDAVLRAHMTPGFFLNKEFGSALARRCGRGMNYLEYLLQGGEVYDGRNSWRNKRMVQPYADALREVVSLDGPSDSVLAAILRLQGSSDSFEDALIKNIDADDLAEDLGREPSEEELREAALVPIQPILKMATKFNDPKKLFGVVDKLRRANKESMKKEQDPEPAVFIATCHKWKGLEAKHVYVSMAGGVFPPPEELLARDATPDPVIKAQTMDDERRLGYVAITRGEDTVTIMCPEENYRGKAAEISQFVSEACIGIEGDVEPEENADAEEDSPPESRMASELEEYDFGGVLLNMVTASEDDPVGPDSEMEADWEYLPEES